jgi:aminoglycoside phosphotransferase (APT) family kinase protein
MTSLSVDPHAGVFDHGWLAAVLPASARRFRVADPSLAPVLADAGAELVETDADVEIAPAAELQGQAPLAVVSFAAPAHDSSSLVQRVGRRLLSAAQVRMKARRARSVVRGKGYPRPEVVLWDVRQQFRLPGSARTRRSPVELLPQRALVLGRRDGEGPTLLAASLEAAGARLEEPPSIRAGLVAAMTDRGLLRVAVGPARRQLETQLQALDALQAAAPGSTVADRTPWVLAHGKAGLADWSLERRLPGRRPEQGLSDALRAQCLDFLVELHGAGGAAQNRSPRDDADTIAEVAPDRAQRLTELGGRLDEILANVPRGFGHGDFFLGNLLVQEERLTGVVDWDSGGPGRLPLLDLLHLLHLAQYPLGDEDWGPSLVQHLFSGTWSDGDLTVAEYCGRIGLDADARLLQALAVAYWLDRAAYILRTHRQRRTERRWLEPNVHHVLASLPEGLA